MKTLEGIQVLKKEKRKFLAYNLIIDSWEKLIPFFEDLKNRKLNSVSDLEKWLKDRSELEAVLEEDMAWRYVRMTINTLDDSLSKSYDFFVTEIEPKVAPYSNEFDKKFLDSPFLKELNQERYRIYIRSVKKRTEIFREENIPLITKLQQDAQKYGAITGKMSVEINGEELTMPKASSILLDTDRKKRKVAFEKMGERRLQAKEELNTLFNELVKNRHQVALNAGFSNYRDYMFSAMGRFDYTAKDCFDFHQAIEEQIVPICKKFMQDRKNKLGYETLKPWDSEVDISGKAPLKPFKDGTELTAKTVSCFNHIDPYFGKCIEIMNNMGHLDLDSKKGKAPGGYNYPMYEIGVPFIFMNSVGTLRDLVTMVHEGGHAIHSFLTRDLELTDDKGCPSEVAELASMSMELISMEHWDFFISDKEELKRAKQEQLEKIISILPWIAQVDAFQHWIYTNHTHTDAQRTDEWNRLSKRFGTGMTDWSGFEHLREISWQKQLHIFEVPFYYIEYGMAQLGAIAVWKNYKANGKKAIEQYREALTLGYTKSIGEIYQTAGVKFDFSPTYVKDLASFVMKELEG